MAKTASKELESTKRLMGALVRMKPKPHEEMKVGKAKKSRPPSRSRAKKSGNSP